jgi:Family of unknown function (DUF6176)
MRRLMLKNLSLISGGVLLGLLAAHSAAWIQHRSAKSELKTVSAESPPFTVKLYRFELNPDRLDRFDEWVRFEHAHHAETVATLEREKMYFEAIFRDPAREKDVIYWLAVQGEGGGHTDDSPLAIDRRYDQFMRETLKKGSRTTLTTEYALVPPFLVKEIQSHR